MKLAWWFIGTAVFVTGGWYVLKHTAIGETLESLAEGNSRSAFRPIGSGQDVLDAYESGNFEG
jgi:ABC-type uncharacterized transport system permease subunit